MRLSRTSALAIAALLAAAVQGVAYQDADRKVAGGGISAAGWQGKIDAGAAKKGMSISDSKFAEEGKALHLTIGPAAVYWNPKNIAQGDYTVKATFREPKQTYGHPHPYGIFIGGSQLDSDKHNLLYCVAYRDGTFLVRGFNGGAVSTVVPRSPNAAVNKAAGPEAEVTQEVGWNVKSGEAQCLINGTVVATLEKSEIVGPGKLESTDGIVGLRVSHNSDIVVTNFALSK